MKNEQDILNTIKEKMNDVDVPESLRPEQVEQMLLKQEQTNQSVKANKKKKTYYLGGLTAACLVLAAGIYTFGNSSRNVSLPEEAVAVNEVTEETEEAAEIKALKTAENYDEIYRYLEAKYKEDESDKEGFAITDLFNFRGGVAEEAAAESAAADMAPAETAMAKSATTTGVDYSTTNVRQEGVDEADVVKTDGRYLYVLRDDNHKVSFVDTKDRLTEVHCIEMDEEQFVQEFYLLPEEQKLILICSVYMTESDNGNAYNMARMIWDPSTTQVITYDVRDIENPKEIGNVKQSGSYSTSRLSDGHLYLFSSYSTGGELEKEQPELYIPIVDEKLIEAADIYLPKLETGCMYELITSIDVEVPDKVKDSKAIFTNGGQLYVSNENIYYYETSWAYTNKNEETTIRKISYENGKLTAVAQGTIDGYINDSFSIDEYEGNLRVIVTVGDTNSVYVMDNSLEIIGSIEGLAKEERVYSARFMGSTAYFVTYYETDPLFTVDFSNPKDPQIIGKLKIPGFSDYLHFYGEDKLLGIGMDVDEKTLVTNGVKLSMFDISDKSDVKEEATHVMKNVYSTDVSYDYKAALIDVPRNIICFPAYEEGGQNYYIFSYDEQEGFVCELNEEINGQGMNVTRGVYIKDTLYVVQGNIIEAYSLKTYRKVDDIIM